MFAKDFIWGAAASAQQIEGAVSVDGRGLSIWDVFAEREGAIAGGDCADVACDHYHRAADDVALMQRIGLQAYRFSIAWPRVLPEGVGQVNDAGLAFYDRVVDACLAAGITPFATMFHWDLPQALQDRGGWSHPDSPAWFVEFCVKVVSRLGDRVTNWITLNEPQVHFHHGHLIGNHAPGLQLPLADVLQAGHHMLLAHGKGVAAIRETAGRPVQVGYAPVGCVCLPESIKSEDIVAARDGTLGMHDENIFNNIWWMDPIFGRGYPEDGLRVYGDNAPKFTDADLDIISEPIDFLGLNIYQGHRVRAADDGEIIKSRWEPGHMSTAMHWPVTPEVLYWGPRWISERYQVPIYITENGLANLDWPALDGRVRDPQRIDFMQRYLLELNKAIGDGADVRGYFYWSILDNFEWAEGYRPRFGLIHVDYLTQRRTLKDSALWYHKVIASHGAVLSDMLIEDHPQVQDA
ncbi:MAG: beta-glucosidase [Phycisphaerales bacterium]|nr:beta-glucosidase [Phycisphaerales bacterium]